MHTKTRMCKFYAMRECTRGDSCTFAHTFDELKPMPDYTRTRFCVALSDRGRCDDVNCTYAHSREELRNIGGGPRQQKKLATAPRGLAPPAEAPSRLDSKRVAHRVEEQGGPPGVDMGESMWNLMMLNSLGTLIDEMYIAGPKSGLPRGNSHVAPVKGTCEPCSTIIDNLQIPKPVNEASKADLVTMPVEQTTLRYSPSMDGMQTEQATLHTDSCQTHSDSDTERTTLSSSPDHPFYTHTRGRDCGSPQLTSWQVHVPTGLCYEVKNTFLSFYSAETPDQGSPTLQRRRARSVDSGSNQRCSSVP